MKPRGLTRRAFTARLPLGPPGGKEALLDAAVHRLGPATAKEVAALLQREGGEHRLKRHLGGLVGMGILRLQGQKYVFHEERALNLKVERILNGEQEADERVRADHDRQQKKFRDAWEKGQVRSGLA
jgi:hypothetical protein